MFTSWQPGLQGEGQWALEQRILLAAFPFGFAGGRRTGQTLGRKSLACGRHHREVNVEKPTPRLVHHLGAPPLKLNDGTGRGWTEGGYPPPTMRSPAPEGGILPMLPRHGSLPGGRTAFILLLLWFERVHEP